MPAYSLTEAFPEVTKVEGEVLRYWVRSRSRTTLDHLVDLMGHGGNGECACERFGFKMARDLAKGLTPGLRTECWHIQLAKRYLATEVAIQTIANQAKRQVSLPTRPGKTG
jgi:hypothetical protein